MARRVKLAYIINDAERRTSFNKRKKGIMKKAMELSTLCDTKTCVIFFSPYDPEPAVWPSRAEAMAVLARFQNVPKPERSKRTATPGSIAEQRITKAGEKLGCLREENKQMDMEDFMYRCIDSVDNPMNLDVRDSGEMDKVIDKTLGNITSRMEAMKIKGQDGSVPHDAPVDCYLMEHICGTSDNRF